MPLHHAMHQYIHRSMPSEVNLNIIPQSNQSEAPSQGSLTQSSNSISVFGFTDYREYLKAFHNLKKDSHSGYSMSLFAKRAGLGKNSRGYLKMVIDGKRNLSHQTLRGFTHALGLNASESQYFENLVLFNQAQTPKDRSYYFERMKTASRGRSGTPLKLVKAQLNYYSNWYVVAVRELFGLAESSEDPAWITTQLRQKISKKEAAQALEDLLTLGLLKRNEQGKLIQSEPLVHWKGGFADEMIQQFQTQMIDRAKEALSDDEYEERNASSVTLSCSHHCLAEIKKEIAQFRDKITRVYGTDSRTADSIIQLNLQVFQLTPIQKNKGENKNV